MKRGNTLFYKQYNFSAPNHSCHCVKCVQIRSFFWSVFFRMWENTDQEKLRIWTLLTHSCFKSALFQMEMLLICWLAFHAPIPDEEKNWLEFLFNHTSLRCLKRFFEGLLGLRKTFWVTTKKCENKNQS